MLRRYLALVTLLALSCKNVDQSKRHGRSAGQKKSAILTSQAEYDAADAEYLHKNADFFFHVYKSAFITKLDDLPLNGTVAEAKRPESGFWYPEKDGGTNVAVNSGGGLTPLQKYDQAFNRDGRSAEQWEQAHHHSSLSWAGHCNGMSGAAQRHPQPPVQAVTKNGVSFTPLDIKALLAEIYMSADFEFLGGYRCELDTGGGHPSNRADPTVMDGCDDTNPGTLHTVVSNWIGRQSQTIIMDQKSIKEVWNFPFFKYEVTTLQKGLTATAARAHVAGGAGDYVFNPRAKSFAYVEMKLHYINALNQEHLGTRNTSVLQLTYVLELDAGGHITGGEWVGASQTSHPDFIWLALAPLTPDGTREMGNPFVKADEVLKLWAEAAGLDPLQPPATVERPRFLGAWGQFPNFTVTLDGGQRGAVFAGKPLKLKIARQAPLAQASVTLLLNATEVATLAGEGGGPLSYELTPGLGLNGLELVWKKGDHVVDDRYVRFHVMR